MKKIKFIMAWIIMILIINLISFKFYIVKSENISSVENDPKYKLNIDTNLDNAKFDYNGIHIEGWKLATVPNTKLEVYIDNKKIDEKYIKYSRKYALTAIIKDYGSEEENPFPHFDIDIPKEGISDGNHKLKIGFVTSSGKVLQEVENNISIDTKFFRMHVETIYDRNNYTNEEHALSGWLMTNSEEQKIKLLIDGNYQDNVFERTQRQDVLNYFNNEFDNTNPTPGFSTQVDFSTLTLGLHQIAIRVFDENNRIFGEKVLYVFVIQGKNNNEEIPSKYKLNIDTNLDNAKFDYNGIHIEGWKLATVPNTKLEVYIDNKKIDEKYIKYSRKYALTAIIKDYGSEEENPFPHFDIDIPKEGISDGNHKLKIEFVTSSGKVLQEVENNISIDTKFFRMHVETIYDRNNYTNEEYTLSGWLMTNSEEQKIKLLIDGNYQDNAFERTKRQDVLNYFNNEFDNTNPTPGFSTQVDFSTLTLGLHQIAIRVFDENNRIFGENVLYVFVIQGKNNNEEIPSKYKLNIDTKLDNAKFDYNGIHIEGWKLATVPNTKLEVYIDNKKVDEKYIKYSRKYALTAIIKDYGSEEENPFPHFDIDIPKEGISDGNHKLKIGFVTSSGKVLQEVENNISIDTKFFRMHVETIYDRNNYTNEEHALSGWLMTNSEEQKIKLLIDGNYQDNVFERTQRQDVLNYFNNEFDNTNPTPGFSTQVDFSTLTLGLHQIAIRVFDENNKIFGEEVLYVFIMPGTSAKNRMLLNSIDTSRYPGYKERLETLMETHKNWGFELLYTGLNFSSAVYGEYSIHNANLVPSSSGSEWICPVCGTKSYDTGWYGASDKAIAYYMDPRNFLNDSNVFQFLDANKYEASSVSLTGIQSNVNGTFLQNYASDIDTACRNKGVNPYYVISRLIQENGKSGSTTSKGMDGGDGNTYYNPFNIGASGNSTSEVIANALAKAKYYGWNNMEKALEGGIDFLKTNWLDNYQNTLYQNRFDIDSTNGTSLYSHQYMQNLSAAYSEGNLLRGYYINAGKVDSNLTFIIPVYEGMSSTLSPRPSDSVNSEEYPMNVIVNTESSSLALRSEASTSSTVIARYDKGTILLSVRRGINSTWQHVVTKDGKVGYMSGEYLKQINDEIKCNYSAYVKTEKSGGLNVRTGPSTTAGFSKVDYLPDYTPVTVIDDSTYKGYEGSDWVQWSRIILSDGRQAFVPSSYVKTN